MKFLGKVLTIAAVAVGCSMAFAAPKASACGDGSCMSPGSVINQPAVLDNSFGYNTVLSQPAVLDSCGTQVITQPAVLDNSCGSCGTVLTQPAVIETTPIVEPMYLRRHHHRLFELGTPLFNFGLF